MIEPGIGTEKFKLGSFSDEMSSYLSLATDIELREPFKIYKTKFVWFFFNRTTDKLEQLSLFTGFNEKVLDKVGIGDSYKRLVGELGACRKTDGVFEQEKLDGISFELNDNKSIECISVSVPYQFYGELPDHIHRNLKKGRKKLP